MSGLRTNGLLEILTTKKWMVSPDFVHGVRDAIENNLNGHVALETKGKPLEVFYSLSGDVFKEYAIDNEGSAYRDGIVPKVPFVNVLNVLGPITRNGGACSYGSVDLRDLMMRAASSPNCLGHIFYIDTPGGSAWAKNDFQQAIDFAHERKQPVLAFIDGMCASAGMYLASFCDERYYMHPKDNIGCIGVMAAFYTQKDGSKDKYTSETYHEIYDPESFDKNKWVRDIANDNNDSLLIKELADLGVEFRNDVKAACPKATDEHLHGKMFDAKDVEGILVDGQNTLAGCIERIKKLAEEKGNSASERVENSKTKNKNTMNKKYQTIADACGVTELVVTEEGTHFDLSLCDKLVETLTQAQTTRVELDAANALVGKMKLNAEELKQATEKAVSEAVAKANEEHNKQVEELKSANETALAEQKSTSDAALAEVQKELESVKAQLAEVQQTIADRDEQIKALVSTPSEKKDEGAAPANNGSGTHDAQLVVGAPKYDHSKSPAENAKALEEYKARLNAIAASKTER